jgi:hypothetical protein
VHVLFDTMLSETFCNTCNIVSFCRSKFTIHLFCFCHCISNLRQCHSSYVLLHVNVFVIVSVIRTLDSIKATVYKCVSKVIS